MALTVGYMGPSLPRERISTTFTISISTAMNDEKYKYLLKIYLEQQGFIISWLIALGLLILFAICGTLRRKYKDGNTLKISLNNVWHNKTGFVICVYILLTIVPFGNITFNCAWKHRSYVKTSPWVIYRSQSWHAYLIWNLYYANVKGNKQWTRYLEAWISNYIRIE